MGLLVHRFERPGYKATDKEIRKEMNRDLIGTGLVMLAGIGGIIWMVIALIISIN